MLVFEFYWGWFDHHAGSPALIDSTVVGDRDCEDHSFISETILTEDIDKIISAEMDF